MSLFGSSRDALLIKHISKEVISDIISVEIAFFKLSLIDSNVTIYQESTSKKYFDPVRLFCLVLKEDISMDDQDTGMQVNQLVTFNFLRDDLKDIDLVIETGDVIKFNEKYFEIDNTVENQYWFGRNPDTLPITTEGRSNYGFGYNVAVKCSTHQTRISQLNLVNVRSGLNTVRTNNNLPRNL